MLLIRSAVKVGRKFFGLLQLNSIHGKPFSWAKGKYSSIGSGPALKHSFIVSSFIPFCGLKSRTMLLQEGYIPRFKRLACFCQRRDRHCIITFLFFPVYPFWERLTGADIHFLGGGNFSKGGPWGSSGLLTKEATYHYVAVVYINSLAPMLLEQTNRWR